MVTTPWPPRVSERQPSEIPKCIYFIPKRCFVFYVHCDSGGPLVCKKDNYVLFVSIPNKCFVFYLQGDSGGPLVCKKDNYVLFVSIPNKCFVFYLQGDSGGPLVCKRTTICELYSFLINV